MEKKFSGKIWKFGNDIDTDTIIPGKRGTIPDRNEMKKYAFELLKPEFGSTVQPGDILVAGTNFGCGSSREQAATVLSYNGVRCIIAKSFARIFFRNAFNSGILLLMIVHPFVVSCNLQCQTLDKFVSRPSGHLILTARIAYGLALKTAQSAMIRRRDMLYPPSHISWR